MNRGNVTKTAKLAIIVAAIILSVVGIIVIQLVNNKLQAEKVRQDEIVYNLYDCLENQYFPVEGEATAMEFISQRRIIMHSLHGTVDDYRQFGTMKYDYRLEYVSDNEFKLRATLDTIGSSHKEDYSFSCTLTKNGSEVILSDLETDDPFPEFTTSTMLTGQDKADMEALELKYFQMEWDYLQKQNRSSSSYRSSNGSSSSSSSKKSTTSGSKSRKSLDEIDPSDHDIEMYYLDYQDEFEDEEDAWDDFMDNEDEWDDY